MQIDMSRSTLEALEGTSVIAPNNGRYRFNKASPKNFDSVRDDKSKVNAELVFSTSTNEDVKRLRTSHALGRRMSIQSYSPSDTDKKQKYSVREVLEQANYKATQYLDIGGQHGDSLHIIRAINPLGSTVMIKTDSLEGVRDVKKITEENVSFDYDMCRSALELALPEAHGVVLSIGGSMCVVTKEPQSDITVIQFPYVCGDNLCIYPLIIMSDIEEDNSSSIRNTDIVSTRIINNIVDTCVDIMDQFDEKYRGTTNELCRLYSILDSTIANVKVESDEIRDNLRYTSKPNDVRRSSSMVRQNKIEQHYFEVLGLCEKLKELVQVLDTLSESAAQIGHDAGNYA